MIYSVLLCHLKKKLKLISIFLPFWRLGKVSKCHKQEGKGTCIPDITGAFVDKNGKNLKITQTVAQVKQSLAAIFRAVF